MCLFVPVLPAALAGCDPYFNPAGAEEPARLATHPLPPRGIPASAHLQASAIHPPRRAGCQSYASNDARQNESGATLDRDLRWA